MMFSKILHDVLEDTSVNEEELKRYLLDIMEKDDALETINLVVDLTDVYTKKDFPQYNRKQRKELEAKRLAETAPKAQTIKYADLIDNALDILRYDRDFARVFLREAKKIIEGMDKGSPELYAEAHQILNNCIKKF